MGSVMEQALTGRAHSTSKEAIATGQWKLPVGQCDRISAHRAVCRRVCQWGSMSEGMPVGQCDRMSAHGAVCPRGHQLGSISEGMPAGQCDRMSAHGVVHVCRRGHGGNYLID